ncbi:hypothetical protein [Crinalium epipsammum]|uniref:hypothetical protein n=1 Tax=Crinalium epipsammum TaxID=241425 RepID=UPI0002FB102A|nr:hypothetical protein [Crinalium epipsammum]
MTLQLLFHRKPAYYSLLLFAYSIAWDQNLCLVYFTAITFKSIFLNIYLSAIAISLAQPLPATKTIPAKT